jgi:hypothetical protein
MPEFEFDQRTSQVDTLIKRVVGCKNGSPMSTDAVAFKKVLEPQLRKYQIDDFMRE